MTYEEECSSIFPIEWGIPERIAIEFCNNTRSVVLHRLVNMYVEEKEDNIIRFPVHFRVLKSFGYVPYQSQCSKTSEVEIY